MTLGTHLLTSWLIANACKLPQRERRIVTFVGLGPDLDGFGWLIDRINAIFRISSDYYFEFHHILGHTALVCIFMMALSSAASKQQRLKVSILSLIVFHIHLLGDLIGSKGPDGYHWPIKYLFPFDDQFQWVWNGQWELNSWQNSTITFTLLIIAIYLGYRQKYSFVETISARLDREFFLMLKRYKIIRFNI